MMEIEHVSIALDDVSKRFGRQWILKRLTDRFESGDTIGIRGRNGSGKSTLLRIIAGQLTPSRGKVSYGFQGKPLAVDQVYPLVSWVGPYLEVPEELTVAEFIDFHFRFKPKRNELDPSRWGIKDFLNRKLSDCSSGMRQRVLLGSALYAATPILLLDEPTVTLDDTAVDWFHAELSAARAGRLTIIASNEAADLGPCDRALIL